MSNLCSFDFAYRKTTIVMNSYIKIFVLALAMTCSFPQITDAQVKRTQKTTNSRVQKKNSTTDSFKQSGWQYLQRKYSKFKNTELIAYLPPTHESCKRLADALWNPALSVAAFKSSRGDLYLVVYKNGVPKMGIDSDKATGDMNMWRDIVSFYVNE